MNNMYRGAVVSATIVAAYGTGYGARAWEASHGMLAGLVAGAIILVLVIIGCSTAMKTSD